MKSRIIERILVVDDEVGYRTVVGEYLEKVGYTCTLAPDGFEALRALGDNHFDMVISDIKMHGKDGLALAREALAKYPHLDFIIMTGHSAQYTYVNIIDAGASDFITKPFSVGELKAKIDRIERERQVLSDLRRANDALQTTLRDTIDALASLLEMRDPYTAGHQQRVTALACAIAVEMDLPDSIIDTIRMAGPVHDIGKISVPSEILAKPSKLKENEMSLIRDHSMVGFDILSKVRFQSPIAEIVRQHHERMNGTGYPTGLREQDILLEARILAVADVVEAISSHRPYRPALGIDRALREIVENEGVLYDSEVVNACLRLFNEKGYKLQ
jgi:response regulator RpfG family c-di-GMP phosphodiesterase